MTSEERKIKGRKMTDTDVIYLDNGRWWKRYTNRVLRLLGKRRINEELEDR